VNLENPEAWMPWFYRPGEETKFPNGFLTSHDGTRLHYHYQKPAKESSRDGQILLVLHGIAWWSAPYLKTFSHFLVPQGLTVYALDFRGHGLSGGQPEDLGKSEQVIDDIGMMLQFLRTSYPDKQLLLAGESMGGMFAIAYTARYEQNVEGLILVAPGLNMHSRQILSPDTFLDTINALFQPNKDVVDLLGWRLDVASRGPEFAAMRRADQRGLDKVSLKYMLAISRINALWHVRYPSKIQVPTLILQGLSDNVLSPSGAKVLCERLATKDKRLATFPEMNHNLLWDAETPRVFDEISRWLKAHTNT
jgi:alpha-beta hydrolase superfamily lysophospholipase